MDSRPQLRARQAHSSPPLMEEYTDQVVRSNSRRSDERNHADYYLLRCRADEHLNN
jgi:hypothetical protein